MIAEHADLLIKRTILVCLLAVTGLWLALSSLTFDMKSAVLPTFLFVACSACAAFYTHIRINARIATLFQETGIVIAVSALATILSYQMTTLNLPLLDDTIIAMDAAFGFDWHAYFQIFNQREWLATASNLAYRTTLIQVALVLITLALLGHVWRARELSLMIALSSIVCVTSAGLAPTAGGAGHFQLPASFYLYSTPMVDYAYMSDFFALRAGELTHISLSTPRGLVSLPSYHAALCVLVVIAVRSIPLLLWPLGPLNLFILFTTPVDGGHHLIDVIAGCALALIAFFATRAIHKYSCNQSPSILAKSKMEIAA